MKYCSTCLQPDTRPNIIFNEQGRCPACLYWDTTPDIDWDERQAEIEEIVKFGKDNSDSGYDCIIGVSGGKDSTRQALYVRDVLGMNPLLVALGYSPPQVSQRGVDNLSNLIALGFDLIQINPAPMTWQYLMEKGFEQYANWCKSTEMALFSSVPRIAIAYQIPLIWWGENPALSLGELGSQGKSGSDGNRLKYINTLAGGDLTWMWDSKIRPKDVLQYTYPSDDEMERANLRIVYLGYFWNDWSLRDNAAYSCLRGLEIRNEPPEDIGDPYGVTALDENWVSFNQMIKYLKFGFGRITDYMNEDIRLGRITRDDAIKLTERFDGCVSDRHIESFCDYIGITKEQFWKKVDAFTNKELFEKGSDGRWKRKFKVGVGL